MIRGEKKETYILYLTFQCFATLNINTFQRQVFFLLYKTYTFLFENRHCTFKFF